MRYLARREHSRAELHRKLQPHAEDEAELEAVLDDLERRNWLSDARTAAQLIEYKRTRFGTRRIVHELRQKGIAEELISVSLPGLKEGELDAAREAWRKKFAELPQNDKEKARQIRFLQARGFSLEIIFRLLKLADTGD